MSTLLRIDAETLPRTLVMNPPLTDTEFEALCRESSSIRFERTREGVIRINPLAGGWTSGGNAEIVHQLLSWWDTHERGRVFESSVGFRLPDGSILSPDAAYASPQTLSRLPQAELERLPAGWSRFCDRVALRIRPTAQAPGENGRLDGERSGSRLAH